MCCFTHYAEDIGAITTRFLYNGLYWHSERAGKDEKYHYEKWLKCHNAGIHLLTVWEDEWVNKQEIVKSHIKHILGMCDMRKVFARQTYVKVLSEEQARLFLNDYHIQGFVDSSIYLGMFEKDMNSLIAVASFVKFGDDYVLSRYATSSNIDGGFSKIISYFEKNYSYDQLVTYVDRSFSDGILYKNNGWVMDGEIAPDYSYILPNKVERFHKSSFPKSKFEKDTGLLFDDNMIESELALLNGFDRIWDLGKMRFVKKRP